MIEWFSYRNALRPFVWPKTPPPLTADQLKAREEYMMVWHRVMLKKYRFVEEFNHRYVTTLPVKAGSRTLEIGAGLGSHLPYEDLHHQEYYALEYRPEFCQEIRQVLPPSRVRCADIHRRQDWDDQT